MLLSKILLAYSIPPLRTRFFAYGPRASRKSDKDAYSRRKTEKSRAPRRHVTAGDPTASLLDRLASYRVPHGWFVHFYLLSVSLSAFWFYQICTQRQPFLFLARNSGVTVSNSVSVYRSGCVYAFMLGQAVRRLLECIFFAKKSSSQMWIGHWVLGLLFYAAMSISVWIEGSRMLLVSGYFLAFADSSSCFPRANTSSIRLERTWKHHPPHGSVPLRLTFAIQRSSTPGESAIRTELRIPHCYRLQSYAYTALPRRVPYIFGNGYNWCTGRTICEQDNCLCIDFRADQSGNYRQ